MAISIREHQSALNNTTAISFTLGAGTTVGDLAVVFQLDDFYTLAGLSTPAGTAVTTWTLGASADGGTNGGHVKVWYGSVTTGGASTVTVPFTHTDQERWGGVFILSGATWDTAAASVVAVTSTSHVAPTVTATGTDDLLMCAWMSQSAQVNYTVPGSMTGYTEIDNFITGVDAREVLSASGATGTRTATASTTATYQSASVVVQSSGGAAASAVFQPPGLRAARGLILRNTRR